MPTMGIQTTLVAMKKRARDINNLIAGMEALDLAMDENDMESLDKAVEDLRDLKESLWNKYSDECGGNDNAG